MRYSTHCIASAVDPLPPEFRNLHPIMETSQLTPVTPRLLSPTAPIVPAVCVPWPWSSIRFPSFEIAFQPCTSSM